MRPTKALTVLFLAAIPAWCRLDVGICGTHPLRGAEERTLHRRSMAKQKALVFKSAESGAPASRDIGQIAILEDRGDLISRRNPFNLNGRRVTFRPVDGSATAYRFELDAADLDEAASDGGAPVSLDDDDSREVAIGFEFPFFGTRHTKAFVNSDGNITFGAGDAASSDRSLGRATSGSPRIAGLFMDLDPSKVAGGVRVASGADRLVVTWRAVPEYGVGALNTFQMRLYPDGRIEVAFQGVTSSASVVGIAPGAVQGQAEVVSFTTDSSGEYKAAVAERFSNSAEIDTVFAAQRFYQTHGDSFDFLAFYNNQSIASSSTSVAWESTVRNDRLGIGDLPLDDGRLYGSPRRLQAVLNMGPLSQYPLDPNATVRARATAGDTPLSVLGHEVGHLWSAYVSVPSPGLPDSTPMLGIQGAHWAFTFNSEASLMEGNRIADSGDGASPRFFTTGTVEGYSPLDQYLMGLRPPQDVAPTFYVANPSIGSGNRGPQRGVSFDGARRDVAVDELIRLYGHRTPDHLAAQRQFRIAIILITRAGEEPALVDLDKIEAIRSNFGDYFARATDGRGSMDTSLTPAVSVTVDGPISAGSAATARVRVPLPAADPVTVLLSGGAGMVEFPGSVVIPPGESEVSFPVIGLRPGIDGVAATASDARYGAGWLRVDVE